MPEFALFLHDDPRVFADVSPEEIQAVVAEYSAWRLDLTARGLLVSGQKLCDEGGKSLRAEDGTVRVVDGPYAEAREVLGGYFIVKAPDYERAAELSLECPHLKFGGRIELRQIDAIHDGE